MNRKRIISVAAVLIFLGILIGTAVTQKKDSGNAQKDASVSENTSVSGNAEDKTAGDKTISGNDPDIPGNDETADINPESVIGMDLNDAARVLGARHIVTCGEYEYRDDVPDGQVTAVREKEGAVDTVILTVNINRKQLEEEERAVREQKKLEATSTVLPEITGLYLNDALQRLNENGGIGYTFFITEAETEGMEHEENEGAVVAVLNADHEKINTGDRIMDGETVYIVICCPEILNEQE